MALAVKLMDTDVVEISMVDLDIENSKCILFNEYDELILGSQKKTCL